MEMTLPVTRESMLEAQIDHIEKLIQYVEDAKANKTAGSVTYPRIYDKVFVCPQELNIELRPGIVAQLPLNAAYFDLDEYIVLFLQGARWRLHLLREELVL